MPVVSQKPPDCSVQNTQIAKVAASKTKKDSSQKSEKRDEHEPKPVVYNTVWLSARRTARKIVIDITIDGKSYIFLEEKDPVLETKNISFKKNTETEWEKCFAIHTQETLIMDYAQMFMDENINRPGPVIKDLHFFFYEYNGSDFCLHLLNLIKPEFVTAKALSLGIFEAVIDSNLIEFVNSFGDAKLKLNLFQDLQNKDLLFDLQSKKQQIHELKRMAEADANSVIDQIKKLISNNYEIGSFYRAEQFFESFPKDFVKNVMTGFKLADPARRNKSFTRQYEASVVPLTFVLPVTPTTDLEIYTDEMNIVAVLAETESFPPVQINKVPPLVLEDTDKPRVDTVRGPCCFFSPRRSGS